MKINYEQDKSILEQLKSLEFGSLVHKENKAFLQTTTSIMQLLTIPHKESSAGANPREFQGMKSSTNKKILENMLKNYNIHFTAHHQGVTITALGATLHDDGIFTFDDACLVNGLQSVTMARILVMIKAYQGNRPEVHRKINKSSDQKWKDTIDQFFSPDAAEQLQSISIDHINSVLTWLHLPANKYCLNKFNKMSLEEILMLPLTIKVILLDALVDEENGNEEDMRNFGMSIAEANNETQKVKADDLFGTKHKQLLQDSIFQDISTPYLVEYVRLEADRRTSNLKIIHVLDLLRAILPVTLLIEKEAETAESFVANYAAHRERVYNFFQRLLNILSDEKHPYNYKVQKAFSILRTLMPHLVEVRNDVQLQWDAIKNGLSAQAILNWGHDLRNTALGTKIFYDSQGNERKNVEDINRAVREHLGFSFTNAFPVFVFATRPAIIIDDKYNASYNLSDDQISAMVEAIYSRMVELRLTKSYSSTSNLFRDPALYRGAAQSFRQFLKIQKIPAYDYTDIFSEKI